MSRGQRMAIMAKEKMYANQTHLNLWMNGHFTEVTCKQCFLIVFHLCLFQ